MNGSDVLWTYTDRNGVHRVWTRQDQEAHVAECRRISEILEAQRLRDEPIGGPGGE